MSLKYEVRCTHNQVRCTHNHRIVYCRHGQHHREDGPATEYSDSDRYWYHYGKLHRVDGPAIEYTGDYNEWWINGINYTKEEYESKIRS